MGNDEEGMRGHGTCARIPSGVEVQARYTVYAEIFIDFGCGNYAPQNEAVLVCIPGHAENLSVRMNAPPCAAATTRLCSHYVRPKKSHAKVCTELVLTVCLWKIGILHDQRIFWCFQYTGCVGYRNWVEDKGVKWWLYVSRLADKFLKQDAGNLNLYERLFLVVYCKLYIIGQISITMDYILIFLG